MHEGPCDESEERMGDRKSGWSGPIVGGREVEGRVSGTGKSFIYMLFVSLLFRLSLLQDRKDAKLKGLPVTVAECSFFWKPHGDESVDVTIKVLSGYVDTHWYGIGFAKVCSSSTFLTILGVEELNTQAPLSRPCTARRLGNQRRHLLERRQRRKWHLLKRSRQR